MAGFKSRSQIRRFEDLESRGEIAKGTTEEWKMSTKNLLSLPERIGTKKPSRAKKRLRPKPEKKFYYN